MLPQCLLAVLFPHCLILVSCRFCLPNNGKCCYDKEEPRDEMQALVSRYGYNCIYIEMVRNVWKQRHPGEAADNVTLMQSAVLEPPPGTTASTKLIVSVIGNDSRLRVVTVDENFQTITMHALVVLEWEDHRFGWADSFSGEPDIVFENARKNIWYPRMHNPGVLSKTQSVRISRFGVVNQFREIHAWEMCPFDYTSYPYDYHSCCITHYAKAEHKQFISFKLNSSDPSPVNRTTHGISRLWKDVEFYLSDEFDAVSPRDGDEPTYATCIDFRRGSATARVEVVLPIAVVIVLTILLPMCCDWKTQVLSKAFCLVLQFACSFVLTLETEQLQYGSTVPRMVQLHQLVIWTTTFSLLSTLVIWSLSKRTISRVPPMNVVGVTDLVNRLLWWSTLDREDGKHAMAVGAIKRDTSDFETSESPAMMSRASTSQNSLEEGKEEWKKVWIALNRTLQMIFVYVYVIGTLALLLPP